MKKGEISTILRKLRLIYLTDLMRYRLQLIKNRRINREFVQRNPNIALPPDYLLYESFQINYHKYYTESEATATWLKDYLAKHISLEKLNILDWGCGPGRIIRHLPKVIGNSCNYFGTDYNEKSITWCAKNIPEVAFNLNTLEAKLPYDDGFFDVIYGLSIFTHLSETMHFDWYSELYRILKPNGIMFLTTHGSNFKEKLTLSENLKFDNGELIVRGNTKEGHRTFAAFQPDAFMEKLFNNATILEHTVPKPEKGKWLPQDIWIVRKPSN